MSLNRCSPVWRCLATSAVVVVLLAAACASDDESGAPAPAGEGDSPAANESVEPLAEPPTEPDEPEPVAESVPDEPEPVAESVPDGSAEGLDPAFDVVSVEFSALPGTSTVVASGGGIRVSWPAGEPVGGSPVAGYEVQWALSGEDWDQERRAVVVGLSYTIAGLEAETAYAVRVRPAAVETASVGGASITVGAGAGPIAELVADAPPLGSSSLQSVSAFAGAVNFEMTGEAVWPATITIPVDMGRVGDDGEVLLVSYNESLRAWVPVLGSVLDRDRGFVAAEVYHLSIDQVICGFDLFGLCKSVISIAVSGLLAMKDFVDSAWDASKGWLREGWQHTRDFVLEDIPMLAQAVLERLEETGERVASWVRTSLATVAELTIEVLGQLKSMLLLELGVGISPPLCSGGRPDWVRSFDSDLRSDALLWCNEAALADGSGEVDFGLAETVNRGYSMTMRSNSSSVRFGDPSPNRISADETEFPTSLADLMGSGLHWLVSSGRSAFLPAGATTRFRVPRGALGDATEAEFSYVADIASTHLQAILYGVNILTGGKASASTATVEEITSVAQCAWGTFSNTANAQSSTLERLMAAVVADCVVPKIPDTIKGLTKSAGAAVFFLAVGGFILLYEYGRIAADGTFGPGAHELTITAHPPTAIQPDDTPTTQPAPQQPSRIPGGGADWTVTLAVGANAQGLAGCQTQHCRHLQIALQGAPDSVYDVECWSSRDPNEPWYPDPEQNQIGRWQWPQSELWAEGGCWYGYPGDEVWVTINGTRSNTITWPTTTTPPPEPTPPAGISTAVTAGNLHTCALRSDATISCWGNSDGGLTDAPGGTFTAVTAGPLHSCALRSDGTVTCWGGNDFGKADAPGGTFVAVDAGSHHSCGVRSDRTVTCWGFITRQAPGGAFDAIAVGSGHMCGLGSDGTVTCWGQGDFGNDQGQADAPGGTFTAVDAGTGFSCGLRSDATITCWGRNHIGQADAPDGTFSAVSAGRSYACGLRTSGTIACWGFVGPFSGGRWITAPTGHLVEWPEGGYSAIAAGGEHVCGLRTDGAIECWGRLVDGTDVEG